MTRTLTARELNRAVLARQLLLERTTVPVPRALERMAGAGPGPGPAIRDVGTPPGRSVRPRRRLARPAAARPDRGRSIELPVRRYLGGFGPATRGEIADWAGLTIGRVAPVLDRLRLLRFRAEDGAELLDLPGAPLPSAETVAPVRFLPVWDASLLVHARRARILPEDYRSRIFNTKSPHSLNTVLVDGAVAGTCRSRSAGPVLADRPRLPISGSCRVPRARIRLAISSRC